MTACTTATVLMIGLAFPTIAPNFSYTEFGFEGGKANLEEALHLGDERFDELDAGRISASFQFADDTAIQLSANVLHIKDEHSGNELTQSTVAFSLLFPIPVSDRMDIVPEVGYFFGRTEFCVSEVCTEYDDIAVGYGIGIRWWAALDRVEVRLGYEDTGLEGFESSVSFRTSLWLFSNHSIHLNYTTQESADITTVGYRYTWR